MKDLLKIALIFALLLTAIPMLAFLKPQKDKFAAEESPAVSAEADITEAPPEETPPAEEISAADTLKVLDFTSGQVYEISMRDYVAGAILAEMPASYHEEALKAQAVAARTYAVRQREKQRISPNPELLGADISNDSTKYQAYFTPEQAKAFYGDSYELCLAKAEAAADSTDGIVLIWEGEPIVAAFHSTSGGRTESAETVWGSAVEYLVPVESAEDTSSPTYLDEQVFTEKELRARLEAELDSADLGSDPEKWLSIDERSASGTVTKMTAGGAELTGTDFRRIFSLRSANFTVEYSSGQFTITTKGNGHGVGMSQYGANAMANSGASYEEILLHYYTGAELSHYSG